MPNVSHAYYFRFPALWMLIFDTMSNIVQECILNEENDGAIFSGTFKLIFSTIYELPLIFVCSFHFLNQPRHVTYQMKGNGA